MQLRDGEEMKNKKKTEEIKNKIERIPNKKYDTKRKEKEYETRKHSWTSNNLSFGISNWILPFVVIFNHQESIHSGYNDLRKIACEFIIVWHEPASMHITNEFKFQHIQKAQDFQREKPKFRRRRKKTRDLC